MITVHYDHIRHYVSNPNSYPEWFQINEWPSHPLREAEIGKSHYALLSYWVAYHGCYSDFSTISSSPVLSWDNREDGVKFYSFSFVCFLATPCSMQDIRFLDQGLNPWPLHSERQVLTTGPRGKSQILLFFPPPILLFLKKKKGKWLWDGPFNQPHKASQPASGRGGCCPV